MLTLWVQNVAYVHKPSETVPALWDTTISKDDRGQALGACPGCVSGQILSYADADSLKSEAQPGAHVWRHPSDHHRHQPERWQQCGGDVREAALPLPQVTHLEAAFQGSQPRGWGRVAHPADLLG